MGSNGQDLRAWAALATGLALIVLVSPARLLWASPEAPWWSPFLLWSGLIGLGVMLSRLDG